MRELTVKLGDKSVRLVANFKAAKKIAEEVGDPLMIGRESLLLSMMLERGMPYTPKWDFTVENISLMLFIGMEAAGEKLSKEKLRLEDVQDLVFEVGFVQVRTIVVEYLQLIIGPRPEESLDDMVTEGKSEGN